MSSYTGLLTITVVRAKELRNSGSVHTPYVTITIGQVSERTNPSSNPQAPEWNQTLAFPLNPSDSQQARVVVTVPFVEQPIGEATIPLSELISHAFQQRWYAIHDINDKNYSTGIIQLEVFHDPDHIAPKQAPVSSTIHPQSHAPPSYALATGVPQHISNVPQQPQQSYQPAYAQPPQQPTYAQPSAQYQPPPAYVQPQQSPYQPQPQYQQPPPQPYQPVYCPPQQPQTVVYQAAPPPPPVVYQQPAPQTVVVQQEVIVRRPAPVIAAPVLGVGAGLAAGAVLGGIFGHHHHHHHHGFGFGFHHHHRHHRW